MPKPERCGKCGADPEEGKLPPLRGSRVGPPSRCGRLCVNSFGLAIHQCRPSVGKHPRWLDRWVTGYRRGEEDPVRPAASTAAAFLTRELSPSVAHPHGVAVDVRRHGRFGIGWCKAAHDGVNRASSISNDKHNA